MFTQLLQILRSPKREIRRLFEREATYLVSQVFEEPATMKPDRTLAPMLTGAIRVVSQSELHLPQNIDALARALNILRVVDESRTELLRLQLSSRRLAAQTTWRKSPPKVLPPLEPAHQTFDDLVARMRALHPHVYALWEQINFVENPAEYARRPETSCAIGKRATDEPFAGFVAPYLDGRVLDVGCGPYSVPTYLEGYPVGLIHGIDPLEPFVPHPFTFARSFSEFIPFPDASFQTVIAATSLDHSLSLDRALSEIRRVIEPGGNFLVWDGFVKGSPRYDPSDQNLKPVDSHHFFHFDENWFEEVMQEHGFTVREKLAFDPQPHQPQYSTSFFYALSTR